MNSSNETFYPIDFWLSLYGYPFIQELITTYAITPIWFLSVILSIFSLFILSKNPFSAQPFFSYIRLYVTNTLILSVLALTTFLAFTHKIFIFTNTYEAVFYSIYVFFTAHNSLILFSSCIEICLIVEKILYLLPRRFRRIKLMSFKKFFLSLFILCISVNLPGIFLFETAFADVQLDANTPFRIWYFGLTSFSNSLAGQIFTYLGYLFRDVLPMISKLLFNSLSVYLVRKYVKNKQRIRRSTATSNSNLVNFDRNQTYVALVMNLFTLFEHIVSVASFVFYFAYEFETSSLLYTIVLLFIAMKHLLIFFILVAFNNLFRGEVNNCFRCC